MRGVQRKTSLLKKITISCLALVVIVSMTGCRQSPALVDEIYTKDATTFSDEQFTTSESPSGEQDEFQKTKEENNQTKNTDQKAQTAAEKNPESEPSNTTKSMLSTNGSQPAASFENKNDSRDTAAQSGGQDDSAQTGNGDAADKQGNGNETLPPTENSGAGTEPVEDDVQPNSNPQDNNTDQKGSDSSVEEDPDVPSDTSPSETGGDSTKVPSKNDLPRKTVNDGSGTERNIPRDVYTVTAVGAAAPMVEMLGGSGRLLGSNGDFIDNMLAQEVCPDVAEGSVLRLWNGDGAQPISDEDFELLLQKSPDVCFEISGQETFTADQITRLEELGIGYVPLPQLNSRQSIIDAVGIVAAVLETNESTRERSADIYREYVDWVNHVADKVSGSPQRYTLFASEWDPDVQFYINEDRSDTMTDEVDVPSTFRFPGVEYHDTYYASGFSSHIEHYASGAVWAWSSNMISKEPLYECLQAANITECGMFRGVWHDNPYHPLITGQNDERILMISAREFIHQRYIVAEGIIYNYVYGVLDNTPRMYNATTGRYDIRPGVPEFPVIIAKDGDVANGIKNSPLWQYYSYDDFAGMFTDGQVPWPYDWFLKYHEIAGDYKLLVNPSGFDSWIYGGVDAPLESLWAAATISGSLSMSNLQSEVLGFYEEFFGYTPTYSVIMPNESLNGF